MDEFFFRSRDLRTDCLALKFAGLATVTVVQKNDGEFFACELFFLRTVHFRGFQIILSNRAIAYRVIFSCRENRHEKLALQLAYGNIEFSDVQSFVAARATGRRIFLATEFQSDE